MQSNGANVPDTLPPELIAQMTATAKSAEYAVTYTNNITGVAAASAATIPGLDSSANKLIDSIGGNVIVAAGGIAAVAKLSNAELGQLAGKTLTQTDQLKVATNLAGTAAVAEATANTPNSNTSSAISTAAGTAALGIGAVVIANKTDLTSITGALGGTQNTQQVLTGIGGGQIGPTVGNVVTAKTTTATTSKALSTNQLGTAAVAKSLGVGVGAMAATGGAQGAVGAVGGAFKGFGKATPGDTAGLNFSLNSAPVPAAGFQGTSNRQTVNAASARIIGNGKIPTPKYSSVPDDATPAPINTTASSAIKKAVGLYSVATTRAEQQTQNFLG